MLEWLLIYSNILLEIIMNKVIQYFSVLNKIKAKERLLQGSNFPRASSEVIPHQPVNSGPVALSPFQQYLIINKAMERPFTGNLWHEQSTGFYHCAICDSRLFTFNHKYQSHTGYPSFWRAIEGTITTTDEDVIFDEVNTMRAKYKTDNSIYKRCACSNCKTHLGAVFMDGPPPTFLRYSINSALLRFYDMPDFPNPHIARKQKKALRRTRRVTFLR